MSRVLDVSCMTGDEHFLVLVAFLKGLALRCSSQSTSVAMENKDPWIRCVIPPEILDDAQDLDS